MAHRLFEKKNHVQVYSEYRPIPPRSIMQHIVSFLQQKYTGELNKAIDLGCGSGQSTLALADLDKFKMVIGTDISPEQIEAACEKFSAWQSMEFHVSPSETMPLEADSCQLIISCAAAHWFDLPKVYAETRRVLSENGVIAFMCYEFPTYEWNCPNAQLLDKAIQNVFDVIDEYWAQPFRVAFKKYVDIELPFQDITRAEGFWTERQAEVEDVTGLFRSLSAFQTLCEKVGEDKGDQLLNDLHKILVDNIGDAPILQKTPYYVLMARK